MTPETICNAVVEVARSMKCQTRLKVVGWDASDWSRAILVPALGCVELPALGPIKVSQIEYIDIRVRFQENLSKYGKPQVVDVAQGVGDQLNERKVDFRPIEDGGTFRIDVK